MMCNEKKISCIDIKPNGEMEFLSDKQVEEKIQANSRAKKTRLYRHYDKDNTLLYIGISAEPTRRTKAHIKFADWSEDIARIDIEIIGETREARKAEKYAIREEKPLYNKNFNQ